jgi:hypothetical protein
MPSAGGGGSFSNKKNDQTMQKDQQNYKFSAQKAGLGFTWRFVR